MSLLHEFNSIVCRQFNFLTCPWPGDADRLKVIYQLPINSCSVEKITSDNGHVIKIHGVNQDITAMKETEADLRESEEKFRALADNAPFCIFIVEDDFFHYANNYAIERMGYSEEELGGMHYWDLIHPDERETVHAKEGAWQNGEGGPITGEIRFLTKNNETLAFISSTLFSYSEKPAAMISCKDITDR